MSAITGILAKSEKKISIAMIGLVNSGKTSFVKKILQSQDHIHVTLADSTQLDIRTVNNLSLITWDLSVTIPHNKPLWKRSILGSDVLFFLIDSSDKSKLDLNKRLLFDLVRKNAPIKLLILASKSDLPNSISVNELLNYLELVSIDKSDCNCDLFKFSSQTGEGLYAIGEWLNKTLFKQRERIINYAEIQAALILNEETDHIQEALFVDNPNIILLTAFRELRRKARIFSRTTRIHGTGEEVIEIAHYKIIFMKESSFILVFLVGANDPIPRTIEIARNILQFMPSSYKSDLNLRKLITDLYPLDIAR